MVGLRYLDVCLVLATAPFVLVAGLPALGYAIAAAAWILTRAGNVYVLARAQRVGDVKLRAGLQVAGMMGRLWLVALAVVAARMAGGKDDGIMAAALVLAAFTVYFVLSFFTRGDSLVPARAGAGKADDVMNATETGGIPPAPSEAGSGPRRPGPRAGDVAAPDAAKSSKKRLLLAFLAVWLGGTILLAVVVGKAPRNKEFEPQNEFKLDNWVDLGIFSINKAVLYLFLAGIATCVTMIYVARRMQQRPNRVQTAVEALYQLMRHNITGSAMDSKMAAKWFPFIGALFLFIMFSNLVGYIPLPTNTEHEITVFGVTIPSFSLYAATANLSIPLALAIVVFVSYTVEGVRAKGPIGYLKGLVPGGVTGGMAVFIFGLEVLSNLMRLMSLSIRLFANILAGHLIILFMAGALAVILGFAAIAWFTIPAGIALFAFEVGLVAALQAFIFATLTAIYLGGAVAVDH